MLPVTFWNLNEIFRITIRMSSVLFSRRVFKYIDIFGLDESLTGSPLDYKLIHVPEQVLLQHTIPSLEGSISNILSVSRLDLPPIYVRFYLVVHH
jgi:hypothetical protein